MVFVSSDICFSYGGVSKQVSTKSIAPTHQRISLSDFIRRLLQPPLRRIDSAITLIDILLHVTEVVELEAPSALLFFGRAFVLVLQRFIVLLGTWAEILFCVGEKVMWACAGEV